MQLYDIVLRGLRRRVGRMILLIASLAIGVATVVALVSITQSLQMSIGHRMDTFGANIVIVPKASDLALSYGGITIGSASYDVGEMVLSDLEAVGTIENARNVSVMAPKLVSAASVGSEQVIMTGVQFPDEVRLKQWWSVRGVYPALPNEALLGAHLAEALGVEPDDTVLVEGRTLHVVGVLEENSSQDDYILFVDLALAQEITQQPNRINLVEVAALCHDCPVEELVVQISEVLPQARVTALRQAVTLRMEMVGQLMLFTVVVSVVVTIIGSLVVLMTMLAAVSERRQEIGLFRALGFRQRHIERVILGEAVIVSLIGGLLGWLVGTGVVTIAQPSVAGMAEMVGYLRWDPLLALGALLGTLLIGLGGSLYPARTAARLDPTIALRAL
jgi:putative ABC transport system permease protein